MHLSKHREILAQPSSVTFQKTLMFRYLLFVVFVAVKCANTTKINNSLNSFDRLVFVMQKFCICCILLDRYISALQVYFVLQIHKIKYKRIHQTHLVYLLFIVELATCFDPAGSSSLS